MEDELIGYAESILTELGFVAIDQAVLPKRFTDDWNKSRYSKVFKNSKKEQPLDKRIFDLLQKKIEKHMSLENLNYDPIADLQSTMRRRQSHLFRSKTTMNLYENLPNQILEKNSKLLNSVNPIHKIKTINLNITCKFKQNDKKIILPNQNFQVIFKSQFSINKIDGNLQEFVESNIINAPIDSNANFNEFTGKENQIETVENNSKTSISVLDEIIHQCFEETKVIKLQVQENVEDINNLLKKLNSYSTKYSNRISLKTERHTEISLHSINNKPEFQFYENKKSNFSTDIFEKKINFIS